MVSPMTSEAKVDPLVELCRSAAKVWLGTVVSVGPAPKNFSGRVASYQSVTYAVKRTLKGAETTGEVTVLHLVVKSSATAEPGDVPSLSKKHFKVGAELVVIAEKNDAQQWLCMDESIGSNEASADWVKTVQAACR